MAVLVVQFEGDPLFVGGGVGAHIDNDIEELAFEAGEGLAFAIGRLLKVKTAHGKRMMVLRDVGLEHIGDDTMRGELSGAEVPAEDAAIVTKWRGADEKNAGKNLGFKVHREETGAGVTAESNPTELVV